MSIEAMAVVLHHSKATSTEKIVLLGIANHEGDGGSYPSIATLAKYANVSERSVQRAIERLVEMGEVSVTIQGGGQRDGRYRTNRYDVLVACPEGCDRSKNHRLQPVDNTDSRGDAGVIPEGSGVTPTTVRDDAGDVPGVTPTSPEPSFNRPMNQDDDTPVDNSTVLPFKARSSSSEFDTAIRIAAKAIALRKSKGSGYEASTRTGIANERGDDVRSFLAQGLSAQEVAYKLVGDRTYVRVAMRELGMEYQRPFDADTGAYLAETVF